MKIKVSVEEGEKVGAKVSVIDNSTGNDFDTRNVAPGAEESFTVKADQRVHIGFGEKVEDAKDVDEAGEKQEAVAT